MQEVLVVGSGGLAREFSDYFSDQVTIVGYSSKSLTDQQEFFLCGRMFGDDVSPETVGTDLAVIAIGDAVRRKIISEELLNRGFQFPCFAHATSTVSPKARIGQGVIISPHCVVSPNVVLGDFCYLNYACGIGHDTVLGQCVQINPGAQIGGCTTIGDFCLIGSGAIVIDNTTVGTGAKISSGAVVMAPVDENSSMLGNPARRMRAFEL
jgi:sugar O-acyltransferase (sialic acid O-acetyltransferase NeuD family)